MRYRKPSLVVLMFGGNEAFRLSRDWTKPEEIRQEAEQLVKLVRESAPDAACLVWSPIDAAVRTMGGDLVPRRGSRMVADIFRDVAKEGGCAYWDALGAMGDEGSAIRWLSAGLLNEDLIHPRARGSDLLGHLFDLAIQRAYAASTRRAPPPSPRASSTSTRPSPPPSRACARWRRATAPAGHPSAGRLAHRLALLHRRDAHRAGERFGDAGRGFIAAGKASDRLKPAGVVHELTGEWTVEDALQAAVPGQACRASVASARWAPRGLAAHPLLRGLRRRPTPPARLSLYWLDGPGSGQMEVKVDGNPVPPSRRRPSRSPRPRCASAPSPSPAPPRGAGAQPGRRPPHRAGRGAGPGAARPRL